MARVVVLVHGAWHGAWCWERVVPGLEQRGLRVVAVDLPGHGAGGGALADLHGDAERVRGVVEGIGEPVLLVGHSYGGAVITEAGTNGLVERLVYLASFPLRSDESCMACAANEAEAAAISWEGRPNLADGFDVDGEGLITLDPQVASVCLYNDCDEDTTAWALERIDRHPLATLAQSPASVAWERVPSTYVVCEQDAAVPPELQRVVARRCTDTVAWPTGHSPFLSRPELVVDLLCDLAAAGPGEGSGEPE